MNVTNELSNCLQELLKDDDRPIVVFSSAWPFFRAIGYSNTQVLEELLQVIIDAAANRTLLMPAFSNGYNRNKFNLDTEPSSAGVLSNAFRKTNGVIRTLSAFFSFSVKGPAIPEVYDLIPEDAWGDDSIYHWMELKNARFIMLGVDPSHCSFIHRIEWLLRDLITYRYFKTFEGILSRNDKNIKCQERVFVRSLMPEAINDFRVFNEPLKKAGMLTYFVQGIPVSLYDANQVLSSIIPVMQEDPLVAVVNKNDFKRPKK